MTAATLLAHTPSRREAHPMTDTRPGPDELAVRDWLHERVDGAVRNPPLPPMPEHRPAGYETAPDPDPDGWFRRLYGPDGTSPIEPATSPDPDPEPADDEPDEVAGHEPAAREHQRPPAPRRSLTEAAPHLSPRMSWLVMHAAAAAAGWPLGLVHWGTDTAAWFAAGHWTSPSAWVLYGLGAVAFGLHRRTRRAPWLLAALGAVPVSSIALGVLLYGTA